MTPKTKKSSSSTSSSWRRYISATKLYRRTSMSSQASTSTDSLRIISDKSATVDSLGFVTLASPTNPEIDIVFVHGFDGGSFSTWAKHGDPKYYWPKEWLPKEVGLGRARIHSYGYNLDPKRDMLSNMEFAKQMLCDMVCSPLWFGKLPIILVGHSTGGLLIKMVYILAMKDRFAQRVAQNIKALIFLATPQNPLKKSSLEKWRKTNRCLADKDTMDRFLIGLRDEFKPFMRHVRVVSFIEKQSTYLGMSKSFLVDHTVAKVGALDDVAPLNGNHYSMCKFSSSSDTSYMLLYGKLSALVDEFRIRRDHRGITNTSLSMRIPAAATTAVTQYNYTRRTWQ